MREPKELAEALAMVGVEMGDADGVEIVAPRLRQVAAKLRRKVATNIVGIVGAAHVGIVNKYLAPVCKIETQRVGIAEREEVDLCNHHNLHRVRGAGRRRVTRTQSPKVCGISS